MPTAPRVVAPRVGLLFGVLALGSVIGGCKVASAPAAERGSGSRDAASATIRYEDITSTSGVRFRQDRASSGRKYFVETMGSGVAVIDYDDDGLPDLFFVNGAPLPGYRPKGRLAPALYHNLGDGRFDDVTAGSGLDVTAYGMGTAVGDYDNDGLDDLYVTAVLGPSRLFHNLGHGKFQDVTASAGVDDQSRFGTSAAWIDYNKDGRLDLFVCNYVRYRTVKDDLPCYFKEHIRSYCIPFGYKAEANALYRSDGNGHFTDVSRAARIDEPMGKSLAVAVADYDGDSWPDLFVANDTTPTQLFHNNRDGTFKEVAATAGIAYGVTGSAKAGMGIDIADDRNDGGYSVAMGNFSGEMAGYYQSVGQGFFEERSMAAGIGNPSRSFLTFGTLFLDADNDGWSDLFLANGHVQDNVAVFDEVAYRERPLLYRNTGGAHYLEIGSQAGAPLTEPLVARGAARVDLDNDGRLDLVVTENNGPAHVWRNQTQGGGHWLEVRLRGQRSNRNGFGSRLQIAAAGGLRHVAALQSGSSYLSQSDQRVHFGLGTAKQVDRLQIDWPSGTVDVLTNLPVDRLITITEGEAASAAGK